MALEDYGYQIVLYFLLYSSRYAFEHLINKLHVHKINRRFPILILPSNTSNSKFLIVIMPISTIVSNAGM